MPASREVLADDAARILQRHLPAGELDQLGAQGDVPAVEEGLPEWAHTGKPVVTLTSMSSGMMSVTAFR